MKWHRELPEGARIGAAVISRKAGKWFVCFQTDLPDAATVEREFAPVGTDLGLTSLVALSTGEAVPTPQFTGRAAKALRKARHTVARKRKHSNRQRKARAGVARLHARVASQRRDFAHKLSRSLADRFTHIAFENLNVKGLAAGMLAKSVHNAAWNQLVRFVTCKAANAGGAVKLVDPRGTSQTCPECGTIEPKTLAVRMHRCECGCVIDRDAAAARHTSSSEQNSSRGTAVRRQRIAA